MKAPKSAEQRPSPQPGVGVVQANKTGGPLATPSTYKDEGQGHGHSPQIPWPADRPLENGGKPFKLRQ